MISMVSLTQWSFEGQSGRTCVRCIPSVTVTQLIRRLGLLGLLVMQESVPLPSVGSGGI